jgi:hypothetical protein
MKSNHQNDAVLAWTAFERIEATGGVLIAFFAATLAISLKIMMP